MLRWFSVVVTLVVSLVSVSSAADAAVVFAEDFDGSYDAAWKINTNIWNFCEGVGRKGSRALVYSRGADKAALRSDSPYIPLPVEPGDVVRISGRFRGRSDGARKPELMLECSDAAGRNVFRCETRIVPDNAVDSDGWERLEVVTPFVPRTAEKCFLLVRFPGQFQETAVFDEIRVERVISSPLSALFSSAYRDRESEGSVEFVAEVNVRPDAVVRAELVSRGMDGNSVRTDVPIGADGEARVTLAVEDLVKGESDVVLELRAENGELLGTATNRFTRGEKGEARPRVYTDRYGRTIVDGKPFFPVGLESTIHPDGDSLEHYASGPFNCIRTLGVPTLEQLDKYHARGIMWIAGLQNYYYNVKRAKGGIRFRSLAEVRAELREVIETRKGHPATLAWLTNDELPLGNVPDAEDTYRLFRSLDPDHPVRCCIDQPMNVRAFMCSYDNIATDPYPIGCSHRMVNEAAKWTRITRRQTFGIRSIWQVVQAFDWSWYRKNATPEERTLMRMPTVDEMRSMSWQCIAEGANGIFWYAYNCYHMFTESKAEFERCWLDVCTVAAEVRRFVPMMLSVEPVPSAICASSKVSFRVWRHEGSVWLLVCNADDRPLKTSVTFEGVRFAKGVSAFGTSKFVLGGSQVDLDLKPFAVSMIRLFPGCHGGIPRL